jgi:energy-coupling factor transporter ATP-binding protein EcfA2
MAGDFTARRNIRSIAPLYGIPRSVTDEQLDSVFELAGLTEFADVKLKRYSPGMQQRLAFAVMFQLQPDILLVDGAIAVGDPEFRGVALQAIDHALESGMTLVIASNDLSLVAERCERVLWLDRGSVAGIGPAAEVIGEYEARAGGKAATVEKPARPERPVRPPRLRLRTKQAIVRDAEIFTMKGSPLAEIPAESDVVAELTVETPRRDNLRVAVACALTFTCADGSTIRILPPEPFDVEKPGSMRISVYLPDDTFPDTATLTSVRALLVVDLPPDAQSAVHDLLRAGEPADDDRVGGTWSHEWSPPLKGAGSR